MKSARPLTCSASLVTAAQGTTDAADAVAKMRADGFPSGSTIFLDVERVNTVSPALLDYYRAWMAGVLNDGRYKPGVYVTKPNAPAATRPRRYEAASGAPSHAAILDRFHRRRSTRRRSRPTSDWTMRRSGSSSFDVTQTFNGVSLRIDVNVATKPNPSTP